MVLKVLSYHGWECVAERRAAQVSVQWMGVEGGKEGGKNLYWGFSFPHFPISIWGPSHVMVHSRSPTAVSPLGKHPHRCRCILRGAVALSWACLYPTTLPELVITTTQSTQPSCFCHSYSIEQSMIVQSMTWIYLFMTGVGRTFNLRSGKSKESRVWQ